MTLLFDKQKIRLPYSDQKEQLKNNMMQGGGMMQGGMMNQGQGGMMQNHNNQ